MKISHLLLIASSIAALSACKKDENSAGKQQYSKLIVGTWLSYQQNTKVYDLTNNALIKDTTIDLSATSVTKATYQIFNEDGTSYMTSLPHKIGGALIASVDTTQYSSYTVMGTSLTIKPSTGGSETHPIIVLTTSNLGLDNSFQGTGTPLLGLDTHTAYKFTVVTYFNKQ